jgi:hypothetical protein
MYGLNNLKAMVGVIYRPPHSDVSYWRKFENNIQPILDLNIPVILGGDLNNTYWVLETPLLDILVVNILT